MRAAALACAWSVAMSAVVLSGSAPRPPEPTLADVLGRAATYVADYQRRLSMLVAEERYIQAWSSTGPNGSPRGRRELRSDVTLVKPAGADAWAERRDVFEIDGQVIRRREGDPVRVPPPPEGASMHLGAILAENARFNLGDVERNVNTPLFPLRFLEAGNQARFRFRRSGGAEAAPAAAPVQPSDTVFRVSADVWAIAYEEVRSGTLVRTARRRDQPARGRFWIEPATGRVLASELVLEDRTVRATIEVSFQYAAALDMLLPATMRERCEGRKTASLVEGHATYSRFRRLDR